MWLSPFPYGWPVAIITDRLTSPLSPFVVTLVAPTEMCSDLPVDVVTDVFWVDSDRLDGVAADAAGRATLVSAPSVAVTSRMLAVRRMCHPQERMRQEGTIGHP